jgi:phage terminase large subunit GpA-like protein
MDTAYRAGDQRLWHFECPACAQLQPLKFEQLKWNSNDTTKPDGKWRLDTWSSRRVLRGLSFSVQGLAHLDLLRSCQREIQESARRFPRRIGAWC